MTPILADAGIPMLFFHLPAMALALVPVIAIESFVARRQLGLPGREMLKGVVAANCCSALLGFPLFWLIGVVALLVVGPLLPRVIPESPNPIGRVTEFMSGMVWLGPDSAQRVIPVGLAMLVPAFFVSVFSERWILRKAWPGMTIATLSRFTWTAHLWSYPALIAVWLCYVLWVL